MNQFQYLGQHADTLADGKPVGFSQIVQLSEAEAAEPHNAVLITEGRLVRLSDPQLSREEMKALLDDAGVDYAKNASVEKLTELVDGLTSGVPDANENDPAAEAAEKVGGDQ